MADPDFISDLVRYPRESLLTEVKAWFDPSTPEGQAKIVRCALAMRNHGGGFMLIGFDNATGDPVANGRPADVRVALAYASTSREVYRLLRDNGVLDTALRLDLRGRNGHEKLMERVAVG